MTAAEPTAAPGTSFDDATAVVSDPDGSRHAIVVDAGWTVGNKPNGGYLLAAVARGAAEQARLGALAGFEVLHLAAEAALLDERGVDRRCDDDEDDEREGERRELL